MYAINSGIPLYHGSKGGIRGKLMPKSRADTDFGEGVYLGVSKEQAWSVPSANQDPHYYTVTFRDTNLSHIV